MKYKDRALLGTGIGLIAIAPLTLLISFNTFQALYFSAFGNLDGYETFTGHIFSASVVIVFIVIGVMLVRHSSNIG